jgi:hypothetical protein
MKRQQKVITPSQVLAEAVGSITDNKVERKRVSFDLRTDLHRELKMQALIKEKNIYNLIEEALEQYLKKL